MYKRLSIALLSLLIVFPVFAQDVTAEVTPASTEVVSVPPVATAEPPVIVVNNPPVAPESNSILLHFILEGVLTAAVIVLALKQSKLIPPETVDAVLVRFFDLVKSVTAKTETPLDDTLAGITEDVLRKVVQQELAKQLSTPPSLANSSAKYPVGLG